MGLEFSSLSVSKGTVGGTMAKNTAVGFSVTKSGTGKTKKKKSGYSYLELASAVIYAKTSVGAGQVVVRAQQKAAQLCRKRNLGECDERELQSAITHARQMERVARKRKKHLLEEEEIRRKNNIKAATENTEESTKEVFSQEEMERLMEELSQKMEKLLQDQQEQLCEEEEFWASGSDMSASDLEELKRKHRSDEWKDIVKANMRYLKELFDRLEDEKNNTAGGVVLDLGGVEQAVAAAATEAADFDVSV